MADGKVCVEQITPALYSKMVVKDNICECCDIIKSELDDLKSELKSCKEIIRILCEDVQISKTTPRATGDIMNRDLAEEMQINSCAQDEGWQNVANRGENHKIQGDSSNIYLCIYQISLHRYVTSKKTLRDRGTLVMVVVIKL